MSRQWGNVDRSGCDGNVLGDRKWYLGDTVRVLVLVVVVLVRVLVVVPWVPFGYIVVVDGHGSFGGFGERCRSSKDRSSGHKWDWGDHYWSNRSDWPVGVVPVDVGEGRSPIGMSYLNGNG